MFCFVGISQVMCFLSCPSLHSLESWKQNPIPIKKVDIELCIHCKGLFHTFLHGTRHCITVHQLSIGIFFSYKPWWSVTPVKDIRSKEVIMNSKSQSSIFAIKCRRIFLVESKNQIGCILTTNPFSVVYLYCKCYR